jgi:hypothetical protein
MALLPTMSADMSLGIGEPLAAITSVRAQEY